MSTMLAAFMLMEFQESTLVASGIGSMVTLLLALRKGRPMSTVLGWALAGFMVAYYGAYWVASKLGISKAFASAITSGTAFIWAPLATTVLPKILKKFAGVEESD